MRLVVWLCVGVGLLGVLGCGGPSESVVVSGTVKLDGQPLSHASVTFVPEGATRGLGGSGRTDAEGRYTLTDARGGKGILPGEYRVVISRPLEKDGSAPDPKVPPIESTARETLPARWSDRTATELRATVSKEGRVHEFTLRTAGKGR
jgi:hypothetical protein